MRQDSCESQGNYEIIYEFPAETQEGGQDLVYNIDAHLTNDQSHEIVIQIPMDYMRAEQMDS